MMPMRVMVACVVTLVAFASSSRVVLAQTQRERQIAAERRRLAAERQQLDGKRQSDVADAARFAAQMNGDTIKFGVRNTIRVTKNRAYFNIGVPPVPTPLAKADRAGYYVWRWNVDGIIPFSIVLTADSAMRTGDVDDILKGSRVRRCANVRETSAQACTDSVEAVVQQWGKLIRIEVKDTAIFNLIRRTRPQLGRILIYEPTGRAQSWSVKVRYEGLPIVIPRR